MSVWFSRNTFWSDQCKFFPDGYPCNLLYLNNSHNLCKHCSKAQKELLTELKKFHPERDPDAD